MADASGDSCCLYRVLFSSSSYLKRAEMKRRKRMEEAEAEKAPLRRAQSRCCSSGRRRSSSNSSAATSRTGFRIDCGSAADRPNRCVASLMRRCGGVGAEEIELKCYTLSPNCLLVDSDRRCTLVNRTHGHTRARHLGDLEDGRRHMDVQRPKSMSLIKLRVNPASGKVERSLSIQEIDQDRQFDDCLLEVECTREHRDLVAGWQLEQEQRVRVAERLANRSFVLIERAVQPQPQQQPLQQYVNAIDEHQHEQESGADDSDSDSETRDTRPETREPWAALNAGQLEQEAGEDFEQQLISSISIESDALVESHQQEEAVGSKPAKRKRKGIRLRLAQLSQRFLASSSAGRADQLQSSLLDSAAHEYESAGREPAQEPPSEPSEPQDTRPPASPMDASVANQLAPLTRPESIYLWPSCPLEEAAGRRLEYAAGAALEPRVMISYNHNEGQQYAIELHARLQQLGVRAYLDLYDIRQGDDWQDSLNFAILNCSLFVALVTPSYGETLWTARECKLADVLAKRIVPVNFGLSWPPASLAIQFATLQYVHWLHSGAAAGQSGGEVAAGLRVGRAARRQLEWPAECVEAVAEQLRLSLELELEAPLASRQLKPPSPLSDSGYESTPPAPANLVRVAPIVRQADASPQLNDEPSSAEPPAVHTAASDGFRQLKESQPQQQQQQVDESARAAGKLASRARRNISLGHRAKKALSRVRRSFGPPKLEVSSN